MEKEKNYEKTNSI